VTWYWWLCIILGILIAGAGLGLAAWLVTGALRGSRGSRGKRKSDPEFK
jgi:hypothetical protein